MTTLNKFSSLILALLLAIIYFAVCFSFTACFNKKIVTPQAPIDELVDTGDYKLHLKCTGQGSPTVILDAGAGRSTNDWFNIQPTIAQTNRVCSYDRLGIGKSDVAVSTRTSQTIVDDLNNLLIKANINGPYVLVGHSLGGINIQLYASQHPENVVGMVLVDSSHEEQDIKINGILPAELVKKQEELLSRNPEHLDLKTSLAQARAAHWKQDIPLIVITAGLPPKSPGGPVGLTDEQFGKISQLWQELQKELATRSPQGKQIIAEKSGHFIQKDQPELVISAIREVVETTRKNNK